MRAASLRYEHAEKYIAARQGQGAVNVVTNETVPLVSDDDYVIRIEGTRVPFEPVVETFKEGATAEEVAQQFPTVALGVVYQVIGYYLRHRSEVEAYVARRAAQRAATQALNQSRWPTAGIRERLLARRG